MREGLNHPTKYNATRSLVHIAMPVQSSAGRRRIAAAGAVGGVIGMAGQFGNAFLRPVECYDINSSLCPWVLRRSTVLCINHGLWPDQQQRQSQPRLPQQKAFLSFLLIMILICIVESARVHAVISYFYFAIERTTP